MALAFSYLTRLNLKYLKITHSIKTAIAIGFGYLFTLFFTIPSSQWILVTIIVVMTIQTNIGSFVKRSYARFLGTILGALFGTITILLWPNNVVMIGIVLMLSTILFTYFSFRKDDLSYAGVLGMVTVIMIIMINPPTILNALFRVTDVILGIILSAVVIFLVVPTFAQDMFIKNLSPILKDLSHLFHKSFFQEKRRMTDQQTQKLDEAIAVKTLEQKKLLSDAKAEWPKNEVRLKQCLEISATYFKIHRHLNFMEYYFFANEDLRIVLKNQPDFMGYCEKLYKYLEALAKYINIDNKNPHEINIELPDTQAFKTICFSQLKESDEKINLLYALLLSADRLKYHLQELKRLFFEL